ncbi:MAG: histidinol-phosphate aminotransferase family protein [Deltaproteobacteria bacterium]|nr:histidinol-phosphate aminotransferase family protein [Deltaproteobacteria bacterium]
MSRQDSDPPLPDARPSDVPNPEVLPEPRDAVQRAHRVPRGFPDRHTYLRLDLGEEDTPASPKVGEVLRSLPDSVLAHYPDPWPLRNQLSELHDVPSSWISITAGTDEAIRLVFDCFVEEGARVLLPRPSAGAYLAAAQAGGAFVDRVEFAEDLSFPLEAFRKQLTARTPRLAVVGNPSSPTGTALDRDKLLQLADESPRTLFLIDEVYASYHGCSVLEPGLRGGVPPNVVVIRSFSKDHGLAGLRVGYLVGRPELLNAISVVKPSYTIAAPSLHGAMTALDDLDAMRGRVASRRMLAEKLAAALSVRGLESRVTRAAFVLIRLTPPISNWAAAFAAQKVLVGTRGHVGPLAPYVRVTITSELDLETFLGVLDAVLARGIAGAPRVEGAVGDWDDTGEGMA